MKCCLALTPARAEHGHAPCASPLGLFGRQDTDKKHHVEGPQHERPSPGSLSAYENRHQDRTTPKEEPDVHPQVRLSMLGTPQQCAATAAVCKQHESHASAAEEVEERAGKHGREGRAHLALLTMAMPPLSNPNVSTQAVSSLDITERINIDEALESSVSAG
eukprot:CAMPEP_0179109080 /NCGR_PEP_ID=MMETSP0796-20121207/50845_1 /TAXON_ID=73915 /ORGANISM="Pyrodinium bahamense, Strain pbaha01" /LENGTH=161 /DNA_ID=CAMNT_0020807179 /DNA_START=245 /DNA_END=732 /DNA_ORIENTATION=-